MARKSDAAFEEGDFVVYPTHGVGRILGTETQEVAGIKLEMLVVRFEQDRMTLRVPMEKAKTLGLRTLSSSKQMDQAITTLRGKARVRRTMWSRRAAEYETKIKSGDPVSIAEVVRDLHRRTNQSEQSYSERQMYQAALERLAREYAAIEKIDQDAAALKLEDMMAEAA
jgi:CarD family transcriptional regulator